MSGTDYRQNGTSGGADTRVQRLQKRLVAVMRSDPESGAGTILEYTLVLPIVIVIILLMLVSGFGVYQRGVILGAVQREAIYAAREMSLPGYTDVVTFSRGDLGGVSDVTFGTGGSTGGTGMEVRIDKLQNNPYANIKQLIDGANSATSSSQTRLGQDISKAQLNVGDHLFSAAVPTVELANPVFRAAVARVDQDLKIPIQFPLLEIPPLMDLTGQAQYSALQTTEFIRDLDLGAHYFRASRLQDWVCQHLSKPLGGEECGAGSGGGGGGGSGGGTPSPSSEGTPDPSGGSSTPPAISPPTAVSTPTSTPQPPSASATPTGSPQSAARVVPPPMRVDSGQLGTKWGKHASDYGYHPSDADKRNWYRERIDEVRSSPDEVRQGPYNPDGGGSGDFFFFRKGNDLLITKANGEFVTMFPGAGQNGWFTNAKPI